MVLQLGVPGGPELLIVLLFTIVLFGVPVVLILVIVALWFRRDETGSPPDTGGDEEMKRQIADLQAEVRELRSELQDGDTSTDEADEN